MIEAQLFVIVGGVLKENRDFSHQGRSLISHVCQSSMHFKEFQVLSLQLLLNAVLFQEIQLRYCLAFYSITSQISAIRLYQA